MSEVNTVIYDPEKITVEQMISQLKAAGTYVRMVSEKTASDGRQEAGD